MRGKILIFGLLAFLFSCKSAQEKRIEKDFFYAETLIGKCFTKDIENGVKIKSSNQLSTEIIFIKILAVTHQKNSNVLLIENLESNKKSRTSDLDIYSLKEIGCIKAFDFVKSKKLLTGITKGFDKKEIFYAVDKGFIQMPENRHVEKNLQLMDDNGKKFLLAYLNYIENPKIINKVGKSVLSKENYKFNKDLYKKIRSKKFVLWTIGRMQALDKFGNEGSGFDRYNEKEKAFIIKEIDHFGPLGCYIDCFDFISFSNSLKVNVPKAEAHLLREFIQSKFTRHNFYFLFQVIGTKNTRQYGSGFGAGFSYKKYKGFVKQIILKPLRYLIIWTIDGEQKIFKNY